MTDPNGGGADPGPRSTPDPGGAAPAEPTAPGPPPRYAGQSGALPPGFAGGTPTPPRGFAGPGSPNVPGVPGTPGTSAFPPPAVPAPRATPTPKGSPLRFVLPVALIVLVIGAGFWFLTSKDDSGSNGADLSADGPGEAVTEWLDAMAQNDYEAACKLTESTNVERLKTNGPTCAAAMETMALPGLYDAKGGNKVLKESIDGDTATVTVKIAGSPLPRVPITAIKEDGVWKVAFLGDLRDGGKAGSEEPGSTTTVTVDPGIAAGPGVVFTDWVQRVVAEDYAGACALTATRSVEKFTDGGATCEAGLAAAGAETGLPEGTSGGKIDVQILGVDIDDDGAEVSYQIGSVEPSTTPAVLVIEDGEWRVDLFARASGGGTVAGAESAACEAERRTVEAAVEAYYASEGVYPPDAESLVGGYLNDTPPNAVVDPDGTVTMTNDCA